MLSTGPKKKVLCRKPTQAMCKPTTSATYDCVEGLLVHYSLAVELTSNCELYSADSLCT